MVTTKASSVKLFVTGVCLGAMILLWLSSSQDLENPERDLLAVQLPNRRRDGHDTRGQERSYTEKRRIVHSRINLDWSEVHQMGHGIENLPEVHVPGSRHTAEVSMHTANNENPEEEMILTDISSVPKDILFQKQLSNAIDQDPVNAFMQQERVKMLRGRHYMDQRISTNHPTFKLPNPRSSHNANDYESVSSLEESLFDPLEKRFPFRPEFTFPQPKALRPLEEVKKMKWVRALRKRLSLFVGTQVTMVTTNSGYTDVVVNWLISAVVRSRIPISKILIISLNEGIHTLLQREGIASVYLPMFDFLRPTAQFNRSFELVMVTRLSVMRLINHWGFDVANYDTDAILLRDPQPLYDSLSDSDIIGSIGTIPADFYMEWGVTICIGVVVFRSSRRTG